jgi:uncharacterized damage-inducible protein DinB
MSIETAFLDQAIHHLEKDFMPKIRHAVEGLSVDQIWWRPNSNSNSVGNMILHLCGNVRQWVIAGVGGAPDTRVRDLEFAEEGPIPAPILMDELESIVEEAIATLRELDGNILLDPKRVQVYDVTPVQAIFHVVEHFSYHTGQIVYVVKMLKDENMGFYHF